MGEGLDLFRERFHLLQPAGGRKLRATSLLLYTDEIAKLVAEGVTQMAIRDVLRGKGVKTSLGSVNRFILRLKKSMERG